MEDFLTFEELWQSHKLHEVVEQFVKASCTYDTRYRSIKAICYRVYLIAKEETDGEETEEKRS